MQSNETTTKDQVSSGRAETPPEPGILATFVGGAPHFRVWPVGKAKLIVGRGATSAFILADERLSRQHFSISREHGIWRVEELGSRNATYVNRQRIEGVWSGSSARTVRAGQTVIVLEADIGRLAHPHRLTDPKIVVGPGLQASLALVSQAARDGQNVVVIGETGSGKELAARRFHDAVRRSGPFHALNCAAITEHLLESELFGHVRGAFSGATQARVGLFEAADGGTLFLDELGEMPLLMQAKLLRAIQERQVRRVGENNARTVDVRIVAATNRDLGERIRTGHFREDLYYRVAGSVVRLAPLRERPEEVPYLIGMALRDSGLTVEASLVEDCVVRAWPGNVRELLGAVRFAASSARLGGVTIVSASHLPEVVPAPSLESPAMLASSPPPSLRPPVALVDPTLRTPGGKAMSRSEREAAIVEAFRRDAGADITTMAVAFGVSPATVYRTLQRAGLKKGG